MSGKMPNSSEEDKSTKVQAEDNSIAVGDIRVGGNAGNINISNVTHIYNTTKDDGSPSQKEPVAGESPYMGLRYFDTQDADLFYGREELTRELLARVKNESFLAIVGASGSGKSSVARAGLIPAWKKENERGAIHVITPTAHPLESIAASLTRDSESVTATSTLMDDMSKESRSLRLYVKKTLGETKLLLLVDQFEETFTMCKDLDERKSFIENLLSLADENGAARVVITLRADFYHHCFEYEGLRLTLQKHQENLGAMTQDELREAILRPAETNGWDFQPGLVDLILQDVGMEPGALPLLSHALLETWKRRQGRTLTLLGYHEAGGVKKAIAQTAENIYGILSPSEQRIARSIFLLLTELSEDVQDTRRRVNLEEFLLLNAENQNASLEVLNKLIDSRLITTEQENVTITHEALISHWKRLQNWLSENRRFLIWRQKLNARYIDWQKNKGELLQGSYLVEAEAWLLEQGVILPISEMRYIEESIEYRNRQKRVLRNINLGFLVSYMLIAIISVIIGNYVITRLVTGALSERLNNQLLESGRTVSDSFLNQERQHIQEAFRIIYTEKLAEAIANEDYETILGIAKPIFGSGPIENLILISPNGQEVLHLLQNSNKDEIIVIDKDMGASNFDLVRYLLETRDPNGLPMSSLGGNMINNEIYYYTTLPISVDGKFMGVIIVGTSIKSLLPTFKKIALADVLIYGSNGQIIATTLDPASKDDLKKISISDQQYMAIISNKTEMVTGNNVIVSDHPYTIGYAPLQIGNSRIGVFAVALPSDFVTQSSSDSRKTYQILFSILLFTETTLGFVVWRNLISPLYYLEETSISNKSKSNFGKTERFLFIFLFSFGLILVMATGEFATRIPQIWKVNGNMASDLSSDYMPMKASVLKPISFEILTPISWVDTYLTPNAESPKIFIIGPTFTVNNLNITPTPNWDNTLESIPVNATKTPN